VERQVLVEILQEAFRGISKYQIVLSRGEAEGHRKPRRVGRIRIYDWVENQDEFIMASDVIVSRAGHGTIMKSLVYGKPMILIPIPDHTEQYGNSRRAVSLHVAEMIDQSKLTSDTLGSAIERILQDRQYKANSMHLREAATSLNAVSAACDAIASLTKRD